jgi:hypothetical protein
MKSLTTWTDWILKGLFIICLSTFIYTLYQVSTGDLIPYIYLAGASLVITFHLASLLIATKSNLLIFKLLITSGIINLILFIFCYFNPEALKLFYPVIFLLVIWSVSLGLQGFHERKEHRFNYWLGKMNWFTPIVLSPILLLTLEGSIFWSIAYLLIIFQIIFNLALFTMKSFAKS